MAVPEGLARSNADGILMRQYKTDRVYDAINRRVPVTARMKKRPVTTHEGEAFYINRHDAFSDGGGERQEWDKIPEADKNVHTWLNFNMTRYDRTIRLSGEVMTSGGSVVDPLRDEMRQAMEAAIVDCERSIFMSADAKLSGVDDCTNATTITASSWQWLGTGTNGMRVDVVVASTGATGSGVLNSRITGVTRNSDGTATVTLGTRLASFSDVDTTYAIYRHNTRNKGFWGLPDIVSASNPSVGNYGGVNRSSVEEHKAMTFDNENASASGEMFAYAMTEIETKGNGKKPTVFWVHPWVHNDLIKLARRDARFPGEIRRFELWGETVFIDGIPVLRSRFCPFNTGYGLHEPAFNWTSPKKMPKGAWRRSGNTQGSILLPVDGYWGWEGLWVWQRQLVCAECNGNVLIQNIAANERGTV